MHCPTALPTPTLNPPQRIERRMEAFKELERESKTKAFSKAGLARGEAETPEEVRTGTGAG